MPLDPNFGAQLYDGQPIRLTDAEGNPLPFLPTAQGHPCLAFKDPRYPEFRFEWHPGVQKVYFIRLGDAVPQGEMLASQIENEGAARTAVWIWLRGYREAKTPRLGILAE
jgi:hypothetical protein